jgi:RNA polymerase sigma-70 factor (ECF subfamily)
MSPYRLQSIVDVRLPSVTVEDDERIVAPEAAQKEVLHLFDQHSPRLRRYIGSFGLRAEAADDVLQDVFLSLFRHVLLGRSRHNLRGWIFQVGHNLALKHRRSASRSQRTERSWDDVLSESLVDPGDNPERQLAAAERQRRLRAVLRAMPERDRQCLYLRAEGLRYRDIARALDISLGSVAKSMTRAMTRLMNADAG